MLRTSILRLARALVTLVVAAGAVRAQGTFVILNKSSASIQTGPTTVVPDPAGAFGFSAEIDGTATTPAPPNTVTLPGNGGTRTLTYAPADESWRFEQSFATLAALNAAYPNGTYTVSFGGRSVPLALTGDVYPGVPVATVSNGTFNTGGTLVVERTQPLVITVAFGQNYAAGLSRLAIEVHGPNVELGTSNEGSNFTLNPIVLTVPANTFVAGASYTIELEANRILTIDSTTVPGTAIGAVYSATTRINVIPSGPTSAPVFVGQPVSQTVSPGSTVVFSAATNGAASFAWRRDGVPVPGATSPTLVLAGNAVVAANYTAVATNAVGSTTSQAARLTVTPGPDSGRLVNLAIRTNAGTGAQTLIVGFAVGGAGAAGEKPLLVRGVGPSLAAFGLSGVLADPVATMFQSIVPVATNDNWGGDPQVLARATQVAAFGLASSGSLDAALATSRPPGAYSVQITGKDGGTGVALAEIYDASTGLPLATTPRLINVSARAQVGTGSDILIAGFAIGGTTARTVLIRAIGPGLAPFSVGATLPDPRLQLFTGATIIRENDDWNGDPQLTNIGNAVGAFPIADPRGRDAMLLVTLAPGSYTAQVSGNNSGTGVALVELYEVP